MVEGFAIRARNASFSPADSVMGEGDFAPDSAPIEYGCDGAGDFRISAIKVQNHNGDSVTDLRYCLQNPSTSILWTPWSR